MKSNFSVLLFAGCLLLGSGCSSVPCPPVLKSTDGITIKYNLDGGVSDGSCSFICKDTSVTRCRFVDAGVVECPPVC